MARLVSSAGDGATSFPGLIGLIAVTRIDRHPKRADRRNRELLQWPLVAGEHQITIHDAIGRIAEVSIRVK